MRADGRYWQDVSCTVPELQGDRPVVSKLLYFDCFSGISGDMILGALVDAGLPLDRLTQALGGLAVEGYEIGAERVLRAGVSATKFVVREHAAPGTERRVPGTRHGHHHDQGDHH